jgi:hypothetical protein
MACGLVAGGWLLAGCLLAVGWLLAGIKKSNFIDSWRGCQFTSNQLIY